MKVRELFFDSIPESAVEILSVDEATGSACRKNPRYNVVIGVSSMLQCKTKQALVHQVIQPHLLKRFLEHIANDMAGEMGGTGAVGDTVGQSGIASHCITLCQASHPPVRQIRVAVLRQRFMEPGQSRDLRT